MVLLVRVHCSFQHLSMETVLEACGKLWQSHMVHPTEGLRYGARGLLTWGRSQNVVAPQQEVTALGATGKEESPSK